MSMSAMPPVRIGFEAKRLFQSKTGFGAYARNLLSSLSRNFPEHAYFLFSPFDGAPAEDVQGLISHESITVDELSGDSNVFRSVKNIWEHQKRKLTLYHGLSQWVPRSVRWLKCPKLVTIHDLAYKHYPADFDAEQLKERDKQIMKVCNIADCIVAVSQSTKRDLIEHFEVPASKIHVVYQSCHNRFRRRWTALEIESVKKQYGLPSHYFLHVGSMSARKNLLVIVEALAKLTESERYPLVIIGRKTEYTNVVEEYAKKAGIHHLLVFPTNVSNAELPGVYQGASLFLYLSLYEGFGIPVLEGLCSRIPVVTSNISSLPEAGGAAARIIDPTKSDLVSDAMREISNSNELKQKMIEKGIEHSSQFTSDLFANKTMELYQHTLAQSGSR